MQSHPLGRIELDDTALAPELEAILACNVKSDAYSEFKFGSWRTIVLWNTSGLDDAGLVETVGCRAQIAPKARGLHYINALIERVFDVERLRLVRAHVLEDGVLVPHRDFLELAPGAPRWCRLHLPLATTASCLHSESEWVFHMRRGELWFLDASQTHSACNASTVPRVTLCLDFELGNTPISSLIRAPRELAATTPTIVKREPLDADFRAGLVGLAKVVSRANYREVLNLLARVHFYKDVSIDEFFVWMVDLAHSAGDRELATKLAGFGQFLHVERAMFERYAV